MQDNINSKNRNFDTMTEVLLQALLTPTKDSLEAEVYLNYLDYSLSSEAFQSILQEVMHKIGEMWQQGLTGIAEEHFATVIIGDFLSRSHKTEMAPPNGLKVLIGSVEGEQHTLGVAVVAYAFQQEGWRVINLGANVPGEAFLAFLSDAKPNLLLLSVSRAKWLIRLKKLIKQTRLADSGIVVGLGGRLVEAEPDLVKKMGADFLATTPRQTIQAATALVNAKRQHTKEIQAN